jgi:hypothetical protein
LEFWKNGKMGFGLMDGWVNGNIRLGDKSKKSIISLRKTNIPSFHYSIIPYRLPKRVS